MVELVTSLKVSELAHLLKWSLFRVRQWLALHGRNPSGPVPLSAILTDDPEIWASVIRRQQIERMAGHRMRVSLKTDYSVSELAKLHGWSRPRAYRWMAAKCVKMVQVAPNRKAIPLTSLMAADEDLWSQVILKLRLEQADA